MFTRDTFTWSKCHFTIQNVTQYNRNVHLPLVSVSRVNTAIVNYGCNATWSQHWVNMIGIQLTKGASKCEMVHRHTKLLIKTKGMFTWYRYEFIPVLLVRNVIPVRVMPVRVHSGSRTGTKRSYRYEIWPHSVRYHVKLGGTRFRSGRRWVAELTGTGSRMRQRSKTMVCKNEGSQETCKMTPM